MIDRVAAILEAAARSRQGLTLSELARAVDSPVSSAQDLVNGLVATGYLDETDRRYTLGPAPYVLNLIVDRPVVSVVPHADLVRLHEQTGLTAVLAVAVGTDVYYIDHSSADTRFAYLAENRVRRSLLRTSSGWVLLAHRDRRDLWSHLQGAPPEDQQRVDDFLDELPRILETGVCATVKSSDAGDGVAIAVREEGRVVAAVTLVGTREEIDPQRAHLADVLRQASTHWH
jgi:DNA-binding IclR family transcriptional regulator